MLSSFSRLGRGEEGPLRDYQVCAPDLSYYWEGGESKREENKRYGTKNSMYLRSSINRNIFIARGHI